MTVKELIERLSRCDPESTVLEERTGEYRLLHAEDIWSLDGSDDPEYARETADGEFIKGNVVVFRAWS